MGLVDEISDLLAMHMEKDDDSFYDAIVLQRLTDLYLSVAKETSDDVKFKKVLQNNKNHFETVHYTFDLLESGRVCVQHFSDCEKKKPDYSIHNAVLKSDIDHWIDKKGFDDLRFCTVCGAPMDSGWTDNFGSFYCCSESEFNELMNQEYGEGNWRVEPTGEEEWNYETRKSENDEWIPNDAFYTEWY